MQAFGEKIVQVRYGVSCCNPAHVLPGIFNNRNGYYNTYTDYYFQSVVAHLAAKQPNTVGLPQQLRLCYYY